MRNLTENAVADKSLAFALRVIALYKYLCAEKNEYVLSKQVLRSGTSIGANIAEAQCAVSRICCANHVVAAACDDAGAGYNDTPVFLRKGGSERSSEG